MGDTALNLPVKVRTHELEQVQTLLPKIRDELRQADKDEAADEVHRIYDEHVEGKVPVYPDGPEFANYLSMPSEDWRMVIRYLNRERDDQPLRIHWLQTKLTDRIEARMEEME